jgi:hypothetical protein
MQPRGRSRPRFLKFHLRPFKTITCRLCWVAAALEYPFKAHRRVVVRDVIGALNWLGARHPNRRFV